MTSDQRQARAELPPALLRRAQGGDRDALGELVRRIHPLVHRWALARTGDRAEADDVSQQALIQVVRKLDTFRGEARFTSWVFRIVSNAATSAGRSRARHEARTEELEAAPGADERGLAGGSGATMGRTGAGIDPGATVDRERLMARVEACFLSLPPRQRQVFHLVEMEGWSAPEVAEQLEIAGSTVRVLLLQARRAIREEILRTHAELVEACLE